MKDKKKRFKNWDDIAKALSSDNPDDWPEEFQTRGKIPPYPESLDKKIREGMARIDAERELMRRAEKEAGLKRPRAFRFALAAAACMLLALTAGAVYYLSRMTSEIPAGPRITRIEGRAIYNSIEHGEREARKGDELKPGAALRLSGSARVEMRNKRVFVRFTGPGSMYRIDKTDLPGVGLMLESGTVLVSIKKGGEKMPYFIATDKRRYEPMGTKFRLTRDAEKERLEVFKGAVKVTSKKTGKSVVVKTHETREFRQEAHEVIMKDGRRIRGFAIVETHPDVAKLKLTIILPNGQSQTVLMKDVKDILSLRGKQPQ